GFRSVLANTAVFLFFLMVPRAPGSTLFPYTTLFRSFDEQLFDAGRIALALDVLRPFLARSTLLQVIRNERDAGHADHEEIAGKRSEEHTSELQSRENLVCRLLLEKKKNCQP